MYLETNCVKRTKALISLHSKIIRNIPITIFFVIFAPNCI